MMTAHYSPEMVEQVRQMLQEFDNDTVLLYWQALDYTQSPDARRILQAEMERRGLKSPEAA